jgi:hypothetical protein
LLTDLARMFAFANVLSKPGPSAACWASIGNFGAQAIADFAFYSGLFTGVGLTFTAMRAQQAAGIFLTLRSAAQYENAHILKQGAHAWLGGTFGLYYGTTTGVLSDAPNSGWDLLPGVAAFNDFVTAREVCAGS